MKTAFVTGGSRGIGKAIAIELGNNFHVVVGYSNSEDKANDVAKDIISSGGSASTVRVDISNSESVDEAFTSIEKEYTSVDVLINNAGVTKDNILPRMKKDEWLEVIQTNLTGSFYTSQRAIKLMMKNKWGRIIFISSGFPMRLIESCSIIFSLFWSSRNEVISVSMYPGATTLEVIFLDPISLLIDFAKPINPAFDAA